MPLPGPVFAAPAPLPVAPIPLPPVVAAPAPVTPAPPPAGSGSSASLPLLPAQAVVAPGATLDGLVQPGSLSGPTVTYDIAPQVLPDHASFNRSTGEFRFSPAPDQAGTYSFTVTASAPSPTAAGSRAASTTSPTATASPTSSQTITVTVAPASPGPTVVSGQVVDVTGSPLAGVPVLIGSLMTSTDATGHFRLANVPDQPGPLVIDGSHGDEPGAYLMLMGPVIQFLGHGIYAGVDNQVAAPIALPHIDLANATDFSKVNPAQALDLTSPLLPGVTLHVAPDSAMTNSGTPFRGKLALTALPVDKLREVLPPGVVPGSLIGVDGSKLMFTTPAQLTLRNTAGYVPGHVLELMTMDMTSGGFNVTGHLQVSADGQWLNTIDGGVLGSSCLIVRRLAA